MVIFERLFRDITPENTGTGNHNTTKTQMLATTFSFFDKIKSRKIDLILVKQT